MSSAPQRQRASVAPVEQSPGAFSWIGAIVSGVAGIGAHIVGRKFGLSGTNLHGLEAVVMAVVMGAFEAFVPSPSAGVASAGDVNSRRQDRLIRAARGAAIGASIDILYNGFYDHGVSALGRLIVPAGASPDKAEMVGAWTLVALFGAVGLIVAVVRERRTKRR